MIPDSLTATERAALLGIARGAILAHLGAAPAPALPASGRLATEERGLFVTVHVGDELRGCIGAFGGKGPLAVAAARLAVSAASEDPRFPSIDTDDVAELRLSVSVLGARRLVEDPSAIRIGRDGLLVQRDLHRGALLPQVAAERGWTPEQFLKHTCLKAGLPADSWRESDTKVEAYDVEEFGA
jgi:uncharacterized protein